MCVRLPVHTRLVQNADETTANRTTDECGNDTGDLAHTYKHLHTEAHQLWIHTCTSACNRAAYIHAIIHSIQSRSIHKHTQIHRIHIYKYIHVNKTQSIENSWLAYALTRSMSNRPVKLQLLNKSDGIELKVRRYNEIEIRLVC